MLSLAELQHQMRASIQSNTAEQSLESEIESNGLSALSRLQIYQNNYYGTLTDALAGVFPVVVAFVGEVFTRAAIKHFIEENPPHEACLSRYGADFSSFLDSYSHADEVPYLPDLASLEWAIHSLQHMAEPVVENNSKAIKNPNIVLLDSEFPLLNLWMVGTGQLMPEAVHLDQGGQCVCVVLRSGEVKLLAISQAEKETLKKFEQGDNASDDVALQGLKAKDILI